LHPIPYHDQFSANITIVASYQKKVAARPAGSASPANVTPARPQPTPPVYHPPAETHPPQTLPGRPEQTNHVAGPFARPIGTNKPFQRKF
jgi:hypothetical protein